MDFEVILLYFDFILDFNMGLENSVNFMIWYDDFLGIKEGFVIFGLFVNWNIIVG